MPSEGKLPSKLRILVIDDEEGIRQFVCDVLEEMGFEVASAANGQLGLESLEAGPADVVITDIMMPEKDGIETAIEVRRRFPSTKIIAISGGGRAGNLDFLDFAGQVGVAQTLVKPFTREELLTALQKVLEPGT